MATMKTITVSADDLMEGTNGVCLACGQVQYGGVEPDARGYKCEECGAWEVCGMDIALVMGRLEIADEND